jgi:TRAP-type mannitol/chloroaromatic compound transport system permease small subunit
MLPDWPFKFLIVIGSALTAIQYVRLAVINFRAALGLPTTGLDIPELETLD